MCIKVFRGIAVILLFLMLLPSLCYSKKKKPQKNIYIEMIKPTVSEIAIFTKKGTTSYPLLFKDDLIEIGFECVGSGRQIDQIPFTLGNKTSNPIKLIWDESAYIDPDKAAHKLLPLVEIREIERDKQIEADIRYPADIRYIERDKQIPVTIIPPNSKIENIVYPTDYVEWHSREKYSISELFLKARYSVGEWVLNPIFSKKQLKELETLNFGVFMMLKLMEKEKVTVFCLKLQAP